MIFTGLAGLLALSIVETFPSGVTGIVVTLQQSDSESPFFGGVGEAIYSYGDSTGFTPVSLLFPALTFGKPNRGKCKQSPVSRRISYQQDFFPAEKNIFSIPE